MATIRWLPAVVLAVVAGCTTIDSGEPPGPPLPPDLARGADGKPVTGWPASLPANEAKQRIARLLPAYVKDKAGWAGDLHAAFVALDIPQAAPTYCAAIAIIEQESSFSADPVVPGLPAIVRRELDERAGRYGIPALVVSAALRLDSPDGRSYNERIDALRTEKQLNQLFEEMIDRLPLGRRLFADYNPVRTGGPMQVSIDFAERQARERAYPYPVGRSLRDEVFTRRGGVYFGSAILLDYPAPYDAAVYRFADFNAGRYSSRNAAFQIALGRIAGRALAADGDLLRYDHGQAVATPSSVEEAALAIAPRLDMNRAQIRRDLLLEKSADFGRSPLYLRVFELADRAAGRPQARQALPQIDLKSPKIQRKLTTEWFAKRVDERYRTCLARPIDADARRPHG
jgi:hypothetical protein